MEIGETLLVRDRRAWRAWLKRNYRSAAEIWLLYPRVGSGKPQIPYADAVEEALCFGWIDSIIKSYDPQTRAQRYTPRKPGSPYSQINKERLAMLIEAGKVVEGVLPSPEEIDPAAFRFPPDIMRAVRADKEAWKHFRTFTEPYRRIRIAYIEHARERGDEFDKRLANFLRYTRRGKKFGNGIEAFY